MDNPKPDALDDLIARVEAADASQQRELLNEAFVVIHGPKPARVHGGSQELTEWLALHNPFLGMLEAQAFESAALILVPEGREWRIERRFSKAMRPAYASLWATGAKDVDRHDNGTGATPALALAAAALAARKEPK